MVSQVLSNNVDCCAKCGYHILSTQSNVQFYVFVLEATLDQIPCHVNYRRLNKKGE